MYANFIGESSGFGILRPGSAFLNYFHFIGASPGRAECHPKSQLHDGQPSSSLHGRLHPHPESRPSQQGVVSLAESGQDKCSVQPHLSSPFSRSFKRRFARRGSDGRRTDGPRELRARASHRRRKEERRKGTDGELIERRQRPNPPSFRRS